MDFSILILPEAEDDIIDIYNYVTNHDSSGSADKLLDSLEMKCASLNSAPERGHSVPELERINATGFREIHFKPYRIIYQIVGDSIFIHAVLDGRRDLRELLERRLLR
jgi:toxin ParE1/3/4